MTELERALGQLGRELDIPAEPASHSGSAAASAPTAPNSEPKKL